MNKNIENKSTIDEKIIYIISAIIFIIIISYIVYEVFSSRNAFNIENTTISVNDSSLKNEIVDEEKTPIEKEIVFTETEISSFTSTLYDNSQNRMFNIQKAVEVLNGSVIHVNEEFSFNNTIGPMGEENGYKKANGFDSNGKVIQIAGAGMCQISSTLYNAALLANLQITERHPHSRRVYYVPIDRDATVYYPDLDLKFINNTPNDIKIYATTDNYSVNITLKKIEQSN